MTFAILVFVAGILLYGPAQSVLYTERRVAELPNYTPPNPKSKFAKWYYKYVAIIQITGAILFLCGFVLILLNSTGSR